jgi:hypothetical protein
MWTPLPVWGASAPSVAGQQRRPTPSPNADGFAFSITPKPNATFRQGRHRVPRWRRRRRLLPDQGLVFMMGLGAGASAIPRRRRRPAQEISNVVLNNSGNYLRQLTVSKKNLESCARGPRHGAACARVPQSARRRSQDRQTSKRVSKPSRNRIPGRHGPRRGPCRLVPPRFPSALFLRPLRLFALRVVD